MSQGNIEQDTTREKVSLGSNMAWIDDRTIQCDGVKLQLTDGIDLKKSSAELFTIFKDPSFVHNYVSCLEGLDARNVVELGIFQGGSAVFFWNLLQPDHLCCIELNSGANQLTDYIEQQGLGDRFTTHFETDQADKTRVGEIVSDCFGDAPLDVVLDDASHQYLPSLATFEKLFPQLRPGGLYFLEDWKIDLMRVHYGQPPIEQPLHQLVHEVLDLSLVHPDIVPTVRTCHNFVVFERGGAPLDPEQFNLRVILDADRRKFEY